jgi:heme-degrading monooxygenase HmoA
MIVRQVSLKVPAEKQAAFESFWAGQYRKAMSTKPGFIEARLLRYADSEDEYQMFLEFASEADSAAWRASLDHANLAPELKNFAPSTSLKVLNPVA